MQSASPAVSRRLFLDARVRTGSFALLFAIFGLANAIGYRDSYKTLAERLLFAHSLGTNKALQLFYGVPHNLLTVGGYSAWRVGGFGSILAGVWGALAAVRALRAEEDSGRQELVLAGAVGRRGAFGAAVSAILAGCVVLWTASFAGFAAAGLPASGSAFLALAMLSPAVVFAGVGAVASQLAGTQRLALQLASAVLAAAFLLRVVADVGNGLGWLRWATPLGWTEELQAFASPEPGVLLLPLAASALLLGGAGAISLRRDVGRGLLATHDSAAPRLSLLSSPSAQALRSQRGVLAAWSVCLGSFAVVTGVLSRSFTKASIPASLQRELRKLGGASLTTPAGEIGLEFVFLVLLLCLFACSQVGSARSEEAAGRLETVLSLPVGRHRWLGGRLLLALAAAAGLALGAGALAWIGATAVGAAVGLPELLEAGANGLPATIFFLGLGALFYALAPRAGVGLAYGLVVLAFLWDILASLLPVPHWVVESTPFAHIALVPSQPFRALSAAVMVAAGVAAGLAAVMAFRRRDLLSG